MAVKKSAPAAVTAPVAAPITPVVTTPAGGAAAKKQAKSTAAPVVVPIPVAATVDATTEESKDEADTSDLIVSNVIEKVASLTQNLKNLQNSLKVLIKEFDKQKKVIEKVQKKKDKAKKSPSGFAKPCKISDELCDFIGIPRGTEQSRTDVTRFINAYVKQHNLNNPANRREFFPDKKLDAILNVKENVKDGEKVTYFVLQRLISHHFPLSISKIAAAKAVLASTGAK